MHTQIEPVEVIGYSPEAAAAACGVSKSDLYNEIRRGRILVRKSGRRTIITPDELRRYLQPVGTPAHAA